MKSIKILAKMSINALPVLNTSIRWVTFRVMKLGRYVLVDDGGNYATFQELNIRIKRKKIIPHDESSGRLCSSALGQFVYF